MYIKASYPIVDPIPILAIMSSDYGRSILISASLALDETLPNNPLLSRKPESYG